MEFKKKKKKEAENLQAMPQCVKVYQSAVHLLCCISWCRHWDTFTKSRSCWGQDAVGCNQNTFSATSFAVDTYCVGPDRLALLWCGYGGAEHRSLWGAEEAAPRTPGEEGAGWDMDFPAEIL